MYNHNDGKVIKYEKIAKDKNLVTLATAYDHNCSRQQTVEVSDAVLAVMLRYEKLENKYGRNQRNHREDMPDNDYDAAKKGLVMPSADEMLEAEELRKEEEAKIEAEKKHIIEIASLLTVKERRRVYMFAKKGLNYSEIAELDGVSTAAVTLSCKNAYRKLEPYRNFLQNTRVSEWVDLLK